MHLALVSEVSVLDVLCEPVLGIVEATGRRLGRRRPWWQKGIVLVEGW